MEKHGQTDPVPLGLDPLSPEAAAIRAYKDEGCTCERDGIGKPRYDLNCPVHGQKPKCTCLDGCPVHGHEMPFMITPDLAVQTVRLAILGDLMAEGERWRYEQAFERAEKALRALEGATPAATPSPAQIDTATDSVGQRTDPLEQARTVLKALGHSTRLDSRVKQMAVYLDAYGLFVERDTGQRHNVWRRSGVKGQIVHLFAKAERAFMALFVNNELPDDEHMLDAINYAVFAVRLKREGFERWQADTEAMDKVADGEWPWS